MKVKLLILLLIGMSSMLWAKDNLLVIDFTDGSDMSIALSKQPVLSFAEQNLCLRAEGMASEFELSNVERFYFKEHSSDISSPRAAEDYIILWQGDDLIVISTIASNTQVRLYGIDGTLYPSRVNANGEQMEVSLAGLPKGTYLLNINNSRTLKINRK